MRTLSCLAVLTGAALSCNAASAQVWLGQSWPESVPSSSQASVRFDGPVAFDVSPDKGYVIDAEGLGEGRESLSPLGATQRRDVWRDTASGSDRLRLSAHGTIRRADGAPVPPGALDAAAFEPTDYDVRYTRGFVGASGRTASGLDISLTPHAGVGVGSDGGSAEAGAMLKIGSDIGSGLERIAPDGRSAFGERPRWFLYAAGSGRAVGYNFARNRDGDYARSGISHDSGAFLGNASVGIALRRGDMQTSLGVVYREIKAEGLHGGTGIDRDVSEGLVAFQFSIKPRR